MAPVGYMWMPSGRMWMPSGQMPSGQFESMGEFIGHCHFLRNNIWILSSPLNLTQWPINSPTLSNWPLGIGHCQLGGLLLDIPAQRRSAAASVRGIPCIAFKQACTAGAARALRARRTCITEVPSSGTLRRTPWPSWATCGCPVAKCPVAKSRAWGNLLATVTS